LSELVELASLKSICLKFQIDIEMFFVEAECSSSRAVGDGADAGVLAAVFE